MQPPRNLVSPRLDCVLLALVLLVAAGLRVDGIGFGLPALNDADEPLFVGTALEMLAGPSLNPGWFGHPGTVTFYSLALLFAAVGAVGVATGQFADMTAFGAAIYADPALVILPGRLMMALFGIACIWLTFRIGERLGDSRIGLTAAAILAVNAVHIEYSQIIRTDMQASFFMLLCTLAALQIAKDGRRRHYLLAGLFVGLGCATKWPAATIAIAVIGGAIAAPGDARSRWQDLALFAASAVVTLIAVSPYLLIDHATVLANLGGEARPLHPGATGQGFLANLGWYIGAPLFTSLGVAGLVLIVIGLDWRVPGDRRWTYVILPFSLAFLLIIALQSLRWERWVLPLLPFLALAAARALHGLAAHLPARWAPAATGAMLLLLLAPMIDTTRTEAVERRTDTRQLASAWLRAHAPPGSRILIEHAAFDLLSEPWSLRFPLGAAGCVDVHATLAGRIQYSEVEGRRSGRAIVDIGHVDMARLDSCRADFAVVSNHIRYRADARHYRKELARYDRLLAGGTLRFRAAPLPGARSGPEIAIIELAPANRPPAPVKSSTAAPRPEVRQTFARPTFD
ncbi:MAG: glycosyltransferase family 39 protein [Sphingopyxis sp.]|uniref:ArnT family glycosyltransferase n=1 Tax=Sphingopyxis sp. TaxID=1908224 RepID=UPI002ABCF134|nr:glycosyltransferase family 39 protein [Sphingopyxis sp.]MDZ3833310.1 glycosyltransferase family 39 protein [Sphingopyxis sp.]